MASCEENVSLCVFVVVDTIDACQTGPRVSCWLAPGHQSNHQTNCKHRSLLYVCPMLCRLSISCVGCVLQVGSSFGPGGVVSVFNVGVMASICGIPLLRSRSPRRWMGWGSDHTEFVQSGWSLGRGAHDLCSSCVLHVVGWVYSVVVEGLVSCTKALRSILSIRL